MRCGNISFWKKKSKKEELTAVEAKEVAKLTTEECWVREGVECKSHVHDSSTSIKNGSLPRIEGPHGKPRDELVYKPTVDGSSLANKISSLGGNGLSTIEVKKMVDEKLDDIPALDKSLDNEKDERSSEKPTVEIGSKKVDVNCPEAKGELNSRKDQAKPQEYGRVLPKFGEWDVNDPASAEGFTVIFNKARDEKNGGGLKDQFHKVKTFDLRGLTSGGKGRKPSN